MKKFVVMSLLILFAIFFIPWKANIQNQNVLDEMYMRLCMRHPDRYTQATFEGMSRIHFPLKDVLGGSIASQRKDILEYETNDSQISLWSDEDHETGRRIDILISTVSDDASPHRLWLSYHVDTKEIEASFTSGDASLAHDKADSQQAARSLLAFLEEWVRNNGERSLHTSGHYGNILCTETQTTLSLADYLENLP